MRVAAFCVRLTLLCLLLGAGSIFAYSQEIDIVDSDDIPIEEKILYSHQTTFRITAQSQGFGLGFNIGKIKNIHSTRIWDFEITNLFSWKNVRLTNPFTYGAKPFVYGKLNNVLVVRAAYGDQRRITGKPYWGGVEMRFIYQGGVSLAIMKPYYYYVLTVVTDETGHTSEMYDYQTFDHRDEWIEIIGRAPFSEGFKGIKVSPGVNFRAGLNFEFARSEAKVRSLECGAMLDVYPMGVKLMADLGEKTVWKEIQKRTYLLFYISFNIGYRYNKY